MSRRYSRTFHSANLLPLPDWGKRNRFPRLPSTLPDRLTRSSQLTLNVCLGGGGPLHPHPPLPNSAWIHEETLDSLLSLPAMTLSISHAISFCLMSERLCEMERPQRSVSFRPYIQPSPPGYRISLVLLYWRIPPLPLFAPRVPG